MRQASFRKNAPITGKISSMRTISMKCVGCGADLQIKPETIEFVCAYCGSAQVVDRSGGAVTLSLVTEAIGRVQQGTDRTASELALVRLEKELAAINEDYELLTPVKPLPPEHPRPAVKSPFSNLFKNEIERNNDKIRLIDWEIFDMQMKDYEEAMATWSEIKPGLDKARSEISTEIIRHMDIVRRL